MSYQKPVLVQLGNVLDIKGVSYDIAEFAGSYQRKW